MSSDPTQLTQDILRKAEAIDATMEGMAILEGDRYVYLNRAHEAMYGYDPGELLGKTWHLLYSPAEIARLEHDIRPQLLANGHWFGEATGRTKQGRAFESELSLTLLKTGELICACRDTTLRKRAELALRASRDQLAHANQTMSDAIQMRDQFLAMVSHELRTPLTGILGMCDVLSDGALGALNTEQRKALSVAESSAQHLLAVINDLLELSQATSDAIHIARQPYDVAHLCRECIAIVEGSALGKSIRLQLCVTANPLIVDLDPLRMRQVLNLLENAIKFSEAGDTVTLTAGLMESGNLVLSVRDCGMGIPRDHLSRIFDPFYQIDSRLSRRHTGAGLGLSIVRRLVEMHNGTVTVDSAPGHGSLFTVTIPVVPAERRS